MTFSHRRIFNSGVRILLRFLTDGYLLEEQGSIKLEDLY